MAIKGKRRTKRRGVAAAPKPVYVRPKRPLLARRGFQIGALVVIVVGAAAAVTTALVIQHHQNQKNALKATETKIVHRFGASLDNDVSNIGQPFQTTFQPFPTFATDVTDFKDGKLSTSAALRKAGNYASGALSAYDSVVKIPTATMIEGHADLVDLVDGQTLTDDA